MKKSVRKKLQQAGYRITSAKEFLDLSDEEHELIELKIALIDELKRIRRASKVTQNQLAKMLRSSQSRIAMVENARGDISLDLICRALFALGVKKQKLGEMISSPERKR